MSQKLYKRRLEPKLYKPLYSRTRPTKGSGDDFFSGRVVQTSHHELGSATTSHQTSSRGRGQGEDLGGRLRNPSFDTPPPPLRDAQPPERRAHQGRPVLLPTDRPAAPQPAVRPQPTPHPRGAQRLHHAPGGRQKAAPQPPAQRELPIDQAREALLQGQVGGLGGARARHHPRRPAKRPEPRHAIRAHQAPARHGPQRRPVPAERGALGRPSGPEPQGVRARAARQSRAERHHPGAVRRVLLPGRDEGVDLQPAGHAGRGRPGGGGHRPGPAPRGPAGRSPTSCFAATRSWSPPSNNGRTSSASPGSSRS